MIITWPAYIFKKLLPAEFEGVNRFALSRPDTAGFTENLVRKIITMENPVEHNGDDCSDVPLRAVVSSSDDEGTDDEEQNTTEEQVSSSRRVRFDDNIQALSPPKPRRTYAKTPLRQLKKRVVEDGLGSKESTTFPAEHASVESSTSPNVQFDNESVDESSSLQKSTAVDPKTPPRTKKTVTVTDRRMSLRSASKMRQNSEVDSSAAATNEEPLPSSESTVMSTTPTRSTRRRQSGITATPKSLAKLQKVEALGLLGKVPKSAKRNLQKQLMRVRDDGKDMPDNLMALVVEIPSAANLLQLLCENPDLVEVVLLQMSG